MTGTAAAEGRSWRNSAGAWLGIGTAPGTLVLGAQVGGRHDGALPLVVLVAGGIVMCALLAAQGRRGLRPPEGENATLAELSPRYLPPVTDRAVTGLLALAMIGWFGFNVGLGGGAVAALTGVPDVAGVLVLTVPIVAVLLAGGGRWNAVALATTLIAIALIAVVAVRLAPPSPPVTLSPGGSPLVLAADLAGYIGYVSVFAVRAPDFTVGLRGRGDLWWCVGLLVGPALAATVVGAGLAASSGSTDVVAVLAGPEGLPVANLFVAASVIAPTLAAVHSGVFAVRRFSPRLPDWAAVLVLAVPGTVLAAVRVDRLLLTWLTILAAVLPALIPPMTAEALRRHRARRALSEGAPPRTDPRPYPERSTDGAANTDVPAGERGGAPSRGARRRVRATAHAPPANATPPDTDGADGAVARSADAPPAGGARRYVSTWLWAPGAALALGLTLAGFTAAAPAGLAVSSLATVAHSTLTRARGTRRIRS
ncbi:hypothetical protein [Actinomadura rugatobispora]|uniref:Uncharacterized protein n=1 Tax=Actinomadura rugatobispora TaxID=1994 RepID=A0ABW0ZRY4_9ACTN|nr:hypothetical protein GCM10010200_027760 [Actinomadura rugatobispora]